MITLCPVGVDQLEMVGGLRVSQAQIKYSGTVREAFEAKESGVEFHAILWQGTPVGFFKIDPTYPARYAFAHDNELGLRGFLIDRDQQGRGLATAAVKALPGYLQGHYPGAIGLVLSVNCANPAAIACYLKGGFVDTGDLYHLGHAGPQHVMRMVFS